MKEDLASLGSSTNRTYIPIILKIFKSDETELRIAAADAIGMIGPQDSDSDLLAPAANDPVPDVRRAVSQAISVGREAPSPYGQRIASTRRAHPETPPDPAKFTMPVARRVPPILWQRRNIRSSLLCHQRHDGTTAFFKRKAKKGYSNWRNFKRNTAISYKTKNRRETRFKKKDEAIEQVKPDPTDMKALTEYMEKAQSLQAGQFTRLLLDSYQSQLFGAPTVYVLEERQVGQRSYPTRYVVLYQDQALKRPGYRLSWMTAPDNAVKTAQAASLVSEKQEEVHKKEGEALKKRGEALEDLIKKKDEQEKKNFKKGQADLEKELGF